MINLPIGNSDSWLLTQNVCVKQNNNKRTNKKVGSPPQPCNLVLQARSLKPSPNLPRSVFRAVSSHSPQGAPPGRTHQRRQPVAGVTGVFWMAGFRREEGGPATESAVGDWQTASTEAADPDAAPCRLQGAVRRRLQLSPLEPTTPAGPALRPELRTRTRPFLESCEG